MVSPAKHIAFSSPNLHNIHNELEWFNEVLACRLKLYFGHECEQQHISEIAAPKVMPTDSYGRFVLENDLNEEERLLLILALIPHVQPFLLDPFFVKNATYDRPFTEFGGIHKEPHQGFLPTGETVLYLLTGTNIHERNSKLAYLSTEHLFAEKNIINLTHTGDGPSYAGEWKMNDSWVHYFIAGTLPKKLTNDGFSSQRLHTEMDWNELILPEETDEKLDELIAWIQHGQLLMKDWGLARRVKPGFTALFYGPPGTGKTLTASLIGKETGMDVYRVDLSQIVSKYIGETEKNLARVFERAESRNWILFFDEADALFGKRTEVSSSHDRYANQEVSYLLQRLEEYDGLAILATNLKTNLDEAFTRRFQSMIHFPVPPSELRRELWSQSFPAQVKLDDAIDLEEIAEKYVMAGGAIINVVRYCCLQLLSQKRDILSPALLEKGIRRELEKEGRTI